MTDTVQFINNLSGASGSQGAFTHSHGDGPSHSHGADEHGHTHEHLDHPGELRVRSLVEVGVSPILGKFAERDMPNY